MFTKYFNRTSLVAFFLFIMVCLVVNHRTTYGQTPTPTTEPTPAATGFIIGVVEDATSSAGIAGAVVSTDVGGYVVTTDKSGGFGLEVTAGTYVVTASAPGYILSSQSVIVTAGDPSKVGFSLQPETAPAATGFIIGVVEDATSEAGIAGAVVSTDVGGYVVTTDQSGGFGLEVAAGTYVVTASAPGYISSSQSVIVTAGDPSKVGFSLQPETAPGGASVFGFVTDPDENELEGVAVTIDGINYSGQTWTDVDGFFQFESVPAGDYTLTFEFEGYQIQTQGISITEGQEEVDLDVIIMEPIVIASISGSVIDINGEPLESVKVKIKGIKTQFSDEVLTDADGFFEFDELEEDTYVIIAKKRGYKRNKQKVKLEEGQQEEVEIVLKKTK